MIPLDLGIAARVMAAYEDFAKQSAQNTAVDTLTLYCSLHDLGVVVLPEESKLSTNHLPNNCMGYIASVLRIKESDYNGSMQAFFGMSKNDEMQEGNIICYGSGQRGGPLIPMHIGIVKNNKIISKFGAGPVFMHDPHSIPYFHEGEAIRNVFGYVRI